ncbi:MAG: hypothetical protein ABR549_14475 [Mycobacteriales bacterium]
MSRRPVVVVALLAVVAAGAVPAHAAKAKKPKPIKGSYTLNLPPDPSGEALGALKDGCAGINPASQNKHPFTVPAAGTLRVVLDSTDVTHNSTVNADWDLYILDADGVIEDSSHSPTPHEETTDKFKRKAPLTFWVCNLLGAPTAKVTYTFTYA